MKMTLRLRLGFANSLKRDTLRRGTWTNEALRTFGRPTLPVIPNVISLPVSADGPTRYASPGGLTSGPCGPEAAPASRLAWPGNATEQTTRVIYGPSGTGSLGKCRPNVVFGELVANALPWFDIVSADLETENYAVGAAIIGAHSVGAPHKRQRLYFVADNNDNGRQEQRRAQLLDAERASFGNDADGRGTHGSVADDRRERRQRRPDSERTAAQDSQERCESVRDAESRGVDGDVAFAKSEQHDGCGTPGRWRGQSANGGDVGNADHEGLQRRCERRNGPDERTAWQAGLVYCSDGKSRPVEPGTFPLAHGVSHRVGLLRGYGNAIVPQVAATFIKAYAS